MVSCVTYVEWAWLFDVVKQTVANNLWQEYVESLDEQD